MAETEINPGNGPEFLSNGEVVQQLADDYSRYLEIDVSKQKQQFDDSVEGLLTKLDEYCGLVDMIRSDTSLCLGSTLPQIYEKSLEMQKIFDKIDRLEAFVQLVKKNLATMEEQLNKAEDDLGSLGSIKKVLNSISMPSFFSSKKTPSKPTDEKHEFKYAPPEIFRTTDFLPPQSTPVPINQQVHQAEQSEPPGAQSEKTVLVDDKVSPGDPNA